MISDLISMCAVLLSFLFWRFERAVYIQALAFAVKDRDKIFAEKLRRVSEGVDGPTRFALRQLAEELEK